MERPIGGKVHEKVETPEGVTFFRRHSRVEVLGLPQEDQTSFFERAEKLLAGKLQVMHVDNRIILDWIDQGGARGYTRTPTPHGIIDKLSWNLWDLRHERAYRQGKAERVNPPCESCEDTGMSHRYRSWDPQQGRWVDLWQVCPCRGVREVT